MFMPDLEDLVEPVFELLIPDYAKDRLENFSSRLALLRRGNASVSGDGGRLLPQVYFLFPDQYPRSRPHELFEVLYRATSWQRLLELNSFTWASPVGGYKDLVELWEVAPGYLKHYVAEPNDASMAKVLLLASPPQFEVPDKDSPASRYERQVPTYDGTGSRSSGWKYGLVPKPGWEGEQFLDRVQKMWPAKDFCLEHSCPKRHDNISKLAIYLEKPAAGQGPGDLLRKLCDEVWVTMWRAGRNEKIEVEIPQRPLAARSGMDLFRAVFDGFGEWIRRVGKAHPHFEAYHSVKRRREADEAPYTALITPVPEWEGQVAVELRNLDDVLSIALHDSHLSENNGDLFEFDLAYNTLLTLYHRANDWLATIGISGFELPPQPSDEQEFREAVEALQASCSAFVSRQKRRAEQVEALPPVETSVPMEAKPEPIAADDPVAVSEPAAGDDYIDAHEDDQGGPQCFEGITFYSSVLIGFGNATAVGESMAVSILRALLERRTKWKNVSASERAIIASVRSNANDLKNQVSNINKLLKMIGFSLKLRRLRRRDADYELVFVPR